MMLHTCKFRGSCVGKAALLLCVSVKLLLDMYIENMTFESKVALVKSDYWTMKYVYPVCNDVIIWPFITQDWSSVHLVSLRSRPMTSLHTTAQACRKKYAAALLSVAFLCQNQWKSSAGQDCI
jgi:hypothetical protein